MAYKIPQIYLFLEALFFIRWLVREVKAVTVWASGLLMIDCGTDG